jgi:DNA-binding NarL/FixJ family response regulator
MGSPLTGDSRDALDRSPLPAGSPARLDRLTTREREVLELMVEGRSNTAIAESLVVTPGAVEKHITNIFAKLDLPVCDDDHRRVLAVLAYLRVVR